MTRPDPQPTERQQRAGDLVRQAAAEIDAPLGLRERVSAPAARRGRAGWFIGLAGSAAAVLIALVLALPSGPSVVQAAELAERPSQGPAPAAQGPALLDEAVDGVAFPDWTREFGWRATGVRHDKLDGRPATTVFYAKDGGQVAYTIVSGDPLSVPGDARRQRTADTSLAAFGDSVTWERRGHTCVLSGAPEDTLVKLAVWRGAGAVPF